MSVDGYRFGDQNNGVGGWGFEPKWYLSPFPQTEVNKGYGLVQNPGW